MISAFIVISSILLAAAFTIAWLTRPNLRRRIEAPKYAFQRQLDAYNHQVQDSLKDRTNGGTDEAV
jgi:hypothetical protein